MNAYAVIDIGGTAIKYGCATEEGQFLEKASCPTQAGEGGIPEKVIAIVQNMASRHALAGVAIDTAGIVRPGEDGEIVFAGEATFPGYSGTKLGRLVREAVHLPVCSRAGSGMARVSAPVRSATCACTMRSAFSRTSPRRAR